MVYLTPHRVQRSKNGPEHQLWEERSTAIGQQLLRLHASRVEACSARVLLQHAEVLTSYVQRHPNYTETPALQPSESLPASKLKLVEASSTAAARILRIATQAPHEMLAGWPKGTPFHGGIAHPSLSFPSQRGQAQHAVPTPPLPLPTANLRRIGSIKHSKRKLCLLLRRMLPSVAEVR